MKFSEIKKKYAEKQAAQGTYHNPDGDHQGTIISAEYNHQNDRVYLKIELTDGTLFLSSAEVSDYAVEPLSKLIDPFVTDNGDLEFADIKGYDVAFATKARKAKNGQVFSNIVTIDYISYDSEDDDLLDED